MRPIYYELKWIIPATLELNCWECCWVFEVFVELWPESLAFSALVTNSLLNGWLLTPLWKMLSQPSGVWEVGGWEWKVCFFIISFEMHLILLMLQGICLLLTPSLPIFFSMDDNFPTGLYYLCLMLHEDWPVYIAADPYHTISRLDSIVGIHRYPFCMLSSIFWCTWF